MLEYQSWRSSYNLVLNAGVDCSPMHFPQSPIPNMGLGLHWEAEKRGETPQALGKNGERASESSDTAANSSPLPCDCEASPAVRCAYGIIVHDDSIDELLLAML